MDINNFILFTFIYRITIILTGLSCIVLGYMLFHNRLSNVNSGIEGEAPGYKLKFTNLAQGSVFSLFGIFLICVMIFKDPPSLEQTISETLESNYATICKQNEKTESRPDTLCKTEIEPKKITRIKKTSARNQKTNEEQVSAMDLESSEMEKLITINQLTKDAFFLEKAGKKKHAQNKLEEALFLMANPMNGLAWYYYESDSLEVALRLSQQAITLCPYSANFIDTYAEILFKIGSYEEAILQFKNAHMLDSTTTSEEKLNKFIARYQSILSKQDTTLLIHQIN